MMIDSELASKWIGGSLPMDIEARALWVHAIVKRIPVRSLALQDGIELPEMKLGDWAECQKYCFVCGRRGIVGSFVERLQVHHIQRRPHCHKPFRDRIENLMTVCLPCHSGVLSTMRPAKQLAYKWIRDRAGWSTPSEFINRWLQVRDGPIIKARNRVTASEVLTEIEIINDSR